MMLLKIDGLVRGTVVKRPSLYIKSPYVADIKLDTHSHTFIAHTPSLGCCGLSDKGSTVYMTPNQKVSKTKPKNELGLECEYTVYLSEIGSLLVGIHPKSAEKLVKSALDKNCISALRNLKKLQQETPIYIKEKVDSRFDFTGIDENGIPFIMEVKNVPLAKDNIAYFPDGYKKTKIDTVSPRALKHIKELTYLKKEENRIRCIMCYVIQRTDVNSFQPSETDKEYREAFYEAMQSGVEIVTLVIKWSETGEAYFVKDDLPILHLCTFKTPN